MSTTFTWPLFVEPRAGQESPPDARPYRVPVYLVDVFTLLNPTGNGSALIAVSACLGGELAVFAGDELEALAAKEPEVASQLRSVRVAQRDDFRTVRATELYVGTFDAIEQRARAAGFNAPIPIDGSLQARLTWDGSTVVNQPLDNAARMMSGRMDLLAAVAIGANHAFHNPRSPQGRLQHVFLPLAPVDAIERGEGLALLYPIFDPAVSAQPDNSELAMRHSYNLLLRLQEDVRTQGGNADFARLLLPVPSRSTIEEELTANGYVIRGNLARRLFVNRADEPERLNVVESVLRAFVRQADDDVEIPPQARPDDYARIIGRLLPQISTPGDSRMRSALSDRMRPVPAAAPPPPPANVIPIRTPPSISPAQPPPTLPPPAPVAPERIRRPKPNFGNDFGPPPAPARRTPPDDWTDDFAADRGPGLAPADDFSTDFNAPDERSEPRRQR